MRGRRLVDVCDMASVVIRAQVVKMVGCYWLCWTLQPDKWKKKFSG
jgi:hypothetical protein